MWAGKSLKKQWQRIIIKPTVKIAVGFFFMFKLKLKFN